MSINKIVSRMGLIALLGAGVSSCIKTPYMKMFENAEAYADSAEAYRDSVRISYQKMDSLSNDIAIKMRENLPYLSPLEELTKESRKARRLIFKANHYLQKSRILVDSLKKLEKK